jgi:ABC-type xylose transport system permease subunit
MVPVACIITGIACFYIPRALFFYNLSNLKFFGFVLYHIIIIILFTLITSQHLAGPQNSTDLTDQALLVHCPTTDIPAMWRVF